MSSVMLITALSMGLGVYGYWALAYWYYPLIPYSDGWGLIDAVLVATPLLLGFGGSVFASWRLAQRIASPVEAVASAARAISHGDLNARAVASDGGVGETEDLIADFNSMAARLGQSEAELQYSNSAIAHELRTPLTILRGRLQGLADGVFKPDPTIYRSLTRQVEDLGRLVDDLRTLGLFSAGQIDLQLETIDLREQVNEVVDAVAPEFETAGIAIERNIAPAIVEADGARIRQALLAVLENSRRYSDRGIILIETLKCEGRAVLRCSDFGPGLPLGSETKVFDRFWRGDDSRSRAAGGSGLGLSVVKAVAEAHGGYAKAYSQPGKGTTIEILLPSSVEVAKPTNRLPADMKRKARTEDY